MACSQRIGLSAEQGEGVRATIWVRSLRLLRCWVSYQQTLTDPRQIPLEKNEMVLKHMSQLNACTVRLFITYRARFRGFLCLNSKPPTILLASPCYDMFTSHEEWMAGCAGGSVAAVLSNRPVPGRVVFGFHLAESGTNELMPLCQGPAACSECL
jgi:hypothetical protein